MDGFSRCRQFDPIAWGVLASHDGTPLDDTEFVDASIPFEVWMPRFVEFWGGEGAWEATRPPFVRRCWAVGPKVRAEVVGLIRDRTVWMDAGHMAPVTHAAPFNALLLAWPPLA